LFYTVETFGPLTPPQKEVSGTATRDDEQRQPKEAAQSGTEKAVQVEDVKNEKTASTDVQHVWHKIMVLYAAPLPPHKSFVHKLPTRCFLFMCADLKGLGFRVLAIA
jgi:hypothetical protein